MIREYCDLCGDDVTDQQSGAIHGGDDCDADGNGTMNDHWDIVCPPCYRRVKAFIVSMVKNAKKKGAPT